MRTTVAEEVAERAQYLITQQAILNAASALRGLDLDKFIEAIDRAETLAPFFDPTAYQRNLAAGDPLSAMRELAAAARTFAAQLPTTCRQCGCTEDRACEPDGCSWVAPALCSSCVLAARR